MMDKNQETNSSSCNTIVIHFIALMITSNILSRKLCNHIYMIFLFLTIESTKKHIFLIHSTLHLETDD